MSFVTRGEVFGILFGLLLSSFNDHHIGEKVIIWGVFHLPKISGYSGWDVDGTQLFGSFHWKISGKSGTSEKVVPISRWKLPNGNCVPFTEFLAVFLSGQASLGSLVFPKMAADPSQVSGQTDRQNFILRGTPLSTTYRRGEEQNREEGEMAQTKLGGGRNRGEK